MLWRYLTSSQLVWERSQYGNQPSQFTESCLKACLCCHSQFCWVKSQFVLGQNPNQMDSCTLWWLKTTYLQIWIIATGNLLCTTVEKSANLRWLSILFSALVQSLSFSALGFASCLKNQLCTCAEKRKLSHLALALFSTVVQNKSPVE